MVSSKILVNQWRNEPSSREQLGHHLGFTKSDEEPTSFALTTPMEDPSMKTIACKVVIPVDRQLKITVPEDVPPGPAEVVVVIVPEAVAEKGGTAGDLPRSSLCGRWKDRTDIEDSVENARNLRAKAERRRCE
jgi:hypothetical protein